MTRVWQSLVIQILWTHGRYVNVLSFVHVSALEMCMHNEIKGWVWVQRVVAQNYIS